MLLTVDNVNKVLVGVIKAGAEVDNVIVETRNRTRPPQGEYATIYWKSIQPLNTYRADSTHSETDTEYYEHRINSALCTVQLSIFGDTALEKCIALNNFLNSENRLFDIDTILGISNIGEVVDISTSLNGQVQPRASFDFSFYCEFGKEYTMDFFVIDNTSVYFITK